MSGLSLRASLRRSTSCLVCYGTHSCVSRSRHANPPADCSWRSPVEGVAPNPWTVWGAAMICSVPVHSEWQLCLHSYMFAVDIMSLTWMYSDFSPVIFPVCSRSGPHRLPHLSHGCLYIFWFICQAYAVGNDFVICHIFFCVFSALLRLWGKFEVTTQIKVSVFIWMTLYVSPCVSTHCIYSLAPFK